MDYIERTATGFLRECLSFFPCVSVLGPRQCGKTTLVKALGDNWRFFDLEDRNTFEIVAADPGLFIRSNPGPLIIDEAQLLPDLFPALRVAIDADRQRKGRFLLAGSSSPELLRNISESLAGRAAAVHLAPFTLEERMKMPSSFFDVFRNPSQAAETLENLSSGVSLENVHSHWFRGGYPEPVLLDDKRFYELWMERYIATYIERDVARLFPGLNAPRYRQFVSMLAGLSGSVLNYADVARSLGVSQPTVREYFRIADGTYVWRHIPAYSNDVLKSLQKHPKGYLRDSGLLCHLLAIPDGQRLRSHPLMGRLWESFVTEEILRGLESRGIQHNARHFRTRNGAEIDLILTGPYGMIPVEIKYHGGADMRHLRAMREMIVSMQSPFGLLINNDEVVRKLDDRLFSIPFTHCAGGLFAER